MIMGACMSSSSEEAEQKKRSQKIDKDLEEDSKRLRRECKILLLGMSDRSALYPCDTMGVPG
jgi:guanine nucleotide-binding protein G(i) subunit alpha